MDQIIKILKLLEDTRRDILKYSIVSLLKQIIYRGISILNKAHANEKWESELVIPHNLKKLCII